MSGVVGATVWKIPLVGSNPKYSLVVVTLEKQVNASDIVHGTVLASGLPKAAATIYTSANNTGGGAVPLAITTDRKIIVYYPSGSGVNTGRLDFTCCYFSYE